jgi:hypothetical protein
MALERARARQVRKGNQVKIAFEIFAFVVACLVLFLLYMLFAVMPVAMRTQQLCLERGYPNSEVTWNLEQFCTNLQGTVTVKVDKL